MLNKVILVGRITKDPELKSTAGGMSVLSFSLAVRRPYKNSDGERHSDFINCVAFGQRAEFIEQYFKKGEILSVCGEIQSRMYEDGKKVKHYVNEVIVNSVGFIEGANKRQEETETEGNGAEETAEPTEELPEGAVDDDGLPF